MILLHFVNDYKAKWETVKEKGSHVSVVITGNISPTLTMFRIMEERRNKKNRKKSCQ